LDKWAERATEKEPRLLDHDGLCESIYKNRYGEGRLQHRISFAEETGHPVTPTRVSPALDPFAAAVPAAKFTVTSFTA
jgi:hypothetical protein